MLLPERIVLDWGHGLESRVFFYQWSEVAPSEGAMSVFMLTAHTEIIRMG